MYLQFLFIASLHFFDNKVIAIESVLNMEFMDFNYWPIQNNLK
jgi:hypothetical protein